MPIPRTGLLAGTAIILALGTSVPSRAALAQSQGDIGIKRGDTVNVATGQGFVLGVVLEARGHLFNVRVINGPMRSSATPRSSAGAASSRRTIARTASTRWTTG